MCLSLLACIYRVCEREREGEKEKEDNIIERKQKIPMCVRKKILSLRGEKYQIILVRWRNRGRGEERDDN